MQVASGTLYGPVNLTVIEVGRDDDAWVFLPFDTCTATVRVLDWHHVFVYTGQGDWAIFDVEARRRIAESADHPTLTYGERLSLPNIFCFSPKHHALFLAGKHGPQSRYNRVHEIPLDGGPARVHDLTADAHAARLAPRDDGAVVALSSGGVEGTLRTILHPRAGKVETDLLDDAPFWAALSDYGPRWISPDGRWALRNALGPFLPVSGRHAGLVERFMPGKRTAFTHPDLVRDGEPRYPLALELIELEPLRHAATLVVAYRTAEELRLYPQNVEALTSWFRRPAADRPTLLPRSFAAGADPEQSEIARIAKINILNALDDVVWNTDSTGFSVRVGESQLHWDGNGVGFHRQWRRHVALDGSVGDLTLVESRSLESKLPQISERAYEVARASLRKRSTQIIPLRESSAADLSVAIREMTRRITDGPLADISFAGVLRFRFRFGRRILNEKAMFDLVRDVPIDDVALVVEALRELLISYGEAATRHAATRPWESLMSGDGDDAPAALSEAALSLASLDDDGAAALRGWFRTVDQEHDGFAAEKVFPAYAERTGFRGVDALRFGIWFFLHQWQTVSFEHTWLGLFDVAQETVAPELFARFSYNEARALADSATSKDATGRHSDDVGRLVERVGSSSWGRAAADQLRRLQGGMELGS